MVLSKHFSFGVRILYLIENADHAPLLCSPYDSLPYLWVDTCCTFRSGRNSPFRRPDRSRIHHSGTAFCPRHQTVCTSDRSTGQGRNSWSSCCTMNCWSGTYFSEPQIAFLAPLLDWLNHFTPGATDRVDIFPFQWMVFVFVMTKPTSIALIATRGLKQKLTRTFSSQKIK